MPRQVRGRASIKKQKKQKKYAEPFYNNRELYEMMRDDREKEAKERGKLSLELQKTRDHISKYNGLNEKTDDLCTRVGELESKGGKLSSRQEGQLAVGKAVLSWVPWVIMLIYFGCWLVQRFAEIALKVGGYQ